MSAPVAAIIGGGVIGGGWAARFLLAGWDVLVFDPDPEAERKISEVLENARAAVPQLINKPLPQEGRLQFAKSLEEAVVNARWIQESVPERLEMKCAVYKDIQAACRADAARRRPAPSPIPRRTPGPSGTPARTPQRSRVTPSCRCRPRRAGPAPGSRPSGPGTSTVPGPCIPRAAPVNAVPEQC